jgi:hypothetical protein
MADSETRNRSCPQCLELNQLTLKEKTMGLICRKCFLLNEAAPDMLEALEVVMDTYCLEVNAEHETEGMKKARTLTGLAIRKANGIPY